MRNRKLAESNPAESFDPRKNAVTRQVPVCYGEPARARCTGETTSPEGHLRKGGAQRSGARVEGTRLAKRAEPFLYSGGVQTGVA